MFRKEQQRAYGRMAYHLKRDLEKAGLAPARYDPDYILASVTTFLEKEGLVLTGSGLRRMKRKT